MNRRFLRDYFLLLFGAVTLQIAGMAFRLIIARKLGPEPLGLTGMVFPLYRFLLILATLGLLPTLTRIAALGTASNRDRVALAEEVYHRLIFRCSLVFSAILAIAAPLLGQWVFPDSRVTTLFIVGAMALPFSAVIVARRASLQGKDRNWPLVSSEWGEQLIEAGSVLTIIFLWTMPCVRSAQVMMAGFFIGEIVCLAILNRSWRQINPRPRQLKMTDEVRKDVEQGVRQSFPILANQFLASAAAMAEGWIIPNRLVLSGLGIHAATAASGELWGMVFPIVYAPLLLVNPLAILVLPRTARWERREPRVKTFRKLTVLFAVTGAVGIVASYLLVHYAMDLSMMFYGNPSAAYGIRVLAPVVPFSFFSLLCGTVLQGFGRYRLLTMITAVGVVVRTGMIFALTGLPTYRLQGTILGILVGQAVTAVLCLCSLVSLASSPIPDDVTPSGAAMDGK